MAMMSGAVLDGVGSVGVLLASNPKAYPETHLLGLTVQSVVCAGISIAMCRLRRHQPDAEPMRRVLRSAAADRGAVGLLLLSSLVCMDFLLFIWATRYLASSAVVAIFYATGALSATAWMRRLRKAAGHSVRSAWSLYVAFAAASAGCWLVFVAQHAPGDAHLRIASLPAAGVGLAAISGVLYGTSICLSVVWVNRLQMHTGGNPSTADPSTADSFLFVNIWQAARFALLIPAAVLFAAVWPLRSAMGFTEHMTLRQVIVMALAIGTVWTASSLLIKLSNLLPGARPSHNMLLPLSLVVSVLGLAWLSGAAIPQPQMLIAGASVLCAVNFWAQATTR